MKRIQVYLTFFLIFLFSMSYGQRQVLTSLSDGSGGYKWVTDLITYKGDLYVIGVFDSIGGVPAENIAKFDGSTWHSLPIYLDNVPTGSPWTFIVYKDELYIDARTSDTIGSPMEQEYITKWDGTTWSVLEDGGIVFGHNPKGIECMVVYDSLLFVGGRFGGTSAAPDFRGFGVWDGNSWIVEIDTNIQRYGVPFDFDVNHQGLWIAGSDGLTLWDGDTLVDYPFTKPEIYNLITGENFLYADYKIDTNGIWEPFLITDSDEDHMFIGDDLYFFKRGGFYKMDTVNFEQTLIDSLPNSGLSSTSYDPSPFCFYNGNLIMASDADYDPNGFVLYSIDSTQVVTGLKEQNPIKTKIYPKPSKSNLIIESSEAIEFLEIKNLTGTTLFRIDIKSNKSEIDVSEIPNGLYLISIATRSGIRQTQKVIIQH